MVKDYSTLTLDANENKFNWYSAIIESTIY